MKKSALILILTGSSSVAADTAEKTDGAPTHANVTHGPHKPNVLDTENEFIEAVLLGE